MIFDLVDFFFLNVTATTELYTLSLHDALPISRGFSGSVLRASSQSFSARSSSILARTRAQQRALRSGALSGRGRNNRSAWLMRSEEHTSELQSRLHLVCRLLLEKKK